MFYKQIAKISRSLCLLKLLLMMIQQQNIKCLLNNFNFFRTPCQFAYSPFLLIYQRLFMASVVLAPIWLQSQYQIMELRLFFINILLNITMTTQRLKKLKSLKSLQTDCTLEDSRQKTIKINILKPLNPMSSVKVNSSAQLSTPQQQIPIKKANNDLNLMSVPELSRKQPQLKFLQSSNNTDPQQTQRVRVSKRSHKKSMDDFGQSMDFREMIITNGSINNLNASNNLKMTRGNDRNLIGRQTSRKQQDKISLDQNLTNIIRVSRKEEKKVEDSRVEIEINLDESQQFFQQVDYKNKEKTSQTKKQIDFKDVAPRLRLSSKYETMQAFRSGANLKQNRSNSRIKLRDYMYMVDSGRRIQSQRSQLKNMNNVHQPQPKAPTLLDAKSQQKSNIQNSKSIEPKEKANLKCRKQELKSKYSVSNQTMFGILKNQIFSQIDIAESNLQKVKLELSEVEASAEPTNEQLLILYNLRREMKEYINKKIESTMESIRREKKCNTLKCSNRKDIEDEQLSQLISKI